MAPVRVDGDDAVMKSATATTVSGHRFAYPTVKPLPRPSA
jgi:hypothetical protein